MARYHRRLRPGPAKARPLYHYAVQADGSAVCQPGSRRAGKLVDALARSAAVQGWELGLYTKGSTVAFRLRCTACGGQLPVRDMRQQIAACPNGCRAVARN